MSWKAFAECLRFLKQSGLRQLRLLGGEPLLHPKIKNILEAATADSFFKVITVFTGGVFPENRVQWLASPKIRVLANMNQPSDYPPAKARLVYANVKALLAQGTRVSIGFNIYKPDFDVKGVVNRCVVLGVGNLRIAIANPAYKTPNNIVPYSKRKLLGGRILSLAKACAENAIELIFDCGITPCVFTDAHMGALFKLFPSSLPRIGKCSPVLDITPDLRVMRCFGSGAEEVARLADFPDSRRLNDHFIDKVDAFRTYAAKSLCRRCGYFNKGICQGGCIGANADLIARSRRNKEAAAPFVVTANKALKEKDHAAALRALRTAVKFFPSPETIADYALLLLLQNRPGEARKVALVHERQLRDTHAGWLLKGVLAERRKVPLVAAGCYRRALPGLKKCRQRELSARIDKLLGNTTTFVCA
jgi:hypothetical protein